ncbi:MAG TPA: hypothetical protein VLM85_25580 [Polyangiaceae bacterium]|nr:hypothetical protein [Polyangiaceae bacterium]
MTTPPEPSTLQPRRRRWIYAPLLFGLFGSTLTHGSVVAAVLLRLGAGAAGGAGESGHAGAGDTVDVSLAGPASTAASTATATAPPPEPAPPPPPKAAHEQKSPPLPPLPKPETKDEPEPPPPPEVTPPPVAVSPPAAGSGADETHSGKLSGPTRFGELGAGLGGDTVEGQRALLPHAATCKDPVAGRWESLKYNPGRSDWVHFTLSVRRGAGGVITGTILSHTWSGGVFDRDPPGCSRGGFDMTVSMNAIGHADATGRITFGSSRYSIVAIKCVLLDNAYAPDNFSGTIDPARQEFQSVNNDGANDINAPYVFRRTGCLDE